MGIDRIPEQATNQDHQENRNFGELSGKVQRRHSTQNFCEPLYFPDQSSNLLQDLLDLSGGM